MLTCFLHSTSGLARESAAEKDQSYLETSVGGNFSLQNALLSTNFGSTGKLHYFSAIHEVRAHASYMDVVGHLKRQILTDFKTYYKQQFQRDLLNFVGQIPVDGNKHYDRNEFNIQYFFLTPQYKYLDIIPSDRQALFAVALYWTVLVDQIFYSHFRHTYQTFQRKTLYPKFIGNCTAPSLMSSECGHHQHPRKILQAINDTEDKGNRFDFEREIFKKDENNKTRQRIDYFSILEQSRQIMKEEIKDYFENHQPEIIWTEFWAKCEQEL